MAVAEGEAGTASAWRSSRGAGPPPLNWGNVKDGPVSRHRTTVCVARWSHHLRCAAAAGDEFVPAGPEAVSACAAGRACAPVSGTAEPVADALRAPLHVRRRTRPDLTPIVSADILQPLVVRRTDVPLVTHEFSLYDLWVVSEEQIKKWADEAEQGYDVEELKRRGRGRPGRGAEPMQVVAVRLTVEELQALDAAAAGRDMSRSEAIRAALAHFAA